MRRGKLLGLKLFVLFKNFNKKITVTFKYMNMYIN